MKRTSTLNERYIVENQDCNIESEMKATFSDVFKFLEKGEKAPSQQCIDRILSFASAYSVIKKESKDFPVIDIIKN
jgi:hypothetical protein